MRQGSNNGRRPRGRTNRKQHGGGGGGQSRTHTFDSNGPDGRVRGNARQVYEKYLSLARDATSAGDRVAAEAYFQHAEHYFRILSDSTDPNSGGRRPEERQPQPYGKDDGDYGDDDQPINGHGERHQEARNNGNAAPQASRDNGPRDQGPRDQGPREQSQRDRGPRDQSGRPPREGQGREAQGREGQPRDAQARDAQARDSRPAADQGAPERSQPQADAAPAGGDAEGDSQPRPRRGRPRKPRPEDDGQAVQADSTPETESGPAAS